MDYTAILGEILQAVQDSDSTDLLQTIATNTGTIIELLRTLLASVWVIWIADRFVISVLKSIFSTIS